MLAYSAGNGVLTTVLIVLAIIALLLFILSR